MITPRIRQIHKHCNFMILIQHTSSWTACLFPAEIFLSVIVHSHHNNNVTYRWTNLYYCPQDLYFCKSISCTELYATDHFCICSVFRFTVVCHWSGSHYYIYGQWSDPTRFSSSHRYANERVYIKVAVQCCRVWIKDKTVFPQCYL